MSKRKLVVIGIITALLGWWFFAESDEEKIIAILDSIVSEGAIVSEEHPFDRLAKSKKLAETCNKSVQVILHLADEDHTLVHDQKELTQKLALARSYFKTLAVNHVDTKVSVSGVKAEAKFLGTAHGLRRDNKEFRDSIEGIVYFEKISGDWLIVKAENVGIWPPDE